MLDIAYIRENAELLQRTADAKGIAVSIGELLAADERRRRQLGKVEALRRERNRISERIGERMKRGERAEAERDKGLAQETNEALAGLEAELADAERTLRAFMVLVPNPVSADTPDGKSDADNVEIRRVGEPLVFGFPPLSHVELGERLDLLDIPRGVKIAGSRHYALKGIGCLLHRAVQQLAMDVLEERGFTPMEVPTMVRGETLLNTGFFPTGEDQVFEVADEGKYLVGTSEASLVSYYANEIVDLKEPIRLAAATVCYRKEIARRARTSTACIACASSRKWSRSQYAKAITKHRSGCCRK